MKVTKFFGVCAILFFVNVVHAQTYEVFFVCDTKKIMNQYAHKGMATTLIRALSNNVNVYGNVLASYRQDCQAYNQKFTNLKLLNEAGELVHENDDIKYYVVKISDYSSAGVVGR